MKNSLLLACVLLLGAQMAQAQSCAVSAPFPDTSSAPDAYGYTWSNQTEWGDPYVWVDIEQPGNLRTGLSDDNFIGPINMGMDFPYYWNTYDECYVGSNGYVMFGAGRNVASSVSGFPFFPTPGPPSSANNFIGGLVTDLTFTDANGALIAGAECFAAKVETATDTMFVVTFKNVPYWAGDAANGLEYQGSTTFQILMFTTGKIKLQYKDISPDIYSGYASLNFNCRGIENITGQVGTCVSANMYPPDSQAVTFLRPASSNYSVTDVAVMWVQSSSNQAATYVTNGTPTQFTAYVQNTGTEPVTGPFDVRLRGFNYLNASAIEFQDTAQAPGLLPGQGALVTFDVVVPTSAVKNFNVQARTIYTGTPADAFPSNDSRNVEVIVADTVGQPYTIVGYDRFIFNEYWGVSGADAYDPQTDGSVAGLPGGVYFTPPFYPATVSLVDALMWFGDTDDNFGTPVDPTKYGGFTLELYEDLGTGPDTIPFQTIVVPPDSLIYPPNINQLELWTQRVMLQTPVVLNSGGIYIAFTYNEVDDTIWNAMVSDEHLNSPKSFRMFEVTGGQWAPYRDIEITDFCLRIGIDNNAVGRADAMVANATLGQNYPNPTSGMTTVPFSLERPAQSVKLEVRNLMGQTVFARDLGSLAPGSHSVELNSELGSGVYLYTLTVDGQAQSMRMVVTR